MFFESIMFIAYCAGNAAGAQIFRQEDAPRYIPAIITNAILYGAQIVGLLCEYRLYLYTPFIDHAAVWRCYYVWQNGRRDAAARAAGISEDERRRLGALNGEQDMTDT